MVDSAQRGTFTPLLQQCQGDPHARQRDHRHPLNVHRSAHGETAPVSPRTGFVLAGGGFKGAFELGALDHLINDVGILPQVVTSASAGSILGMVISQARTADEFSSRLVDARNDLLSMTEVEVVFGEQPWLRELHGTRAADALRRVIIEGSSPDHPEFDPDIVEEPPRNGRRNRHNRPSWSEFADIARRVPAAARAQHHDAEARRAVLNLDPFEAAIRGRATGGISQVHPELIARPGLDLRMAVTAIKARDTHYVCGDGTLVDNDAHTPVVGANGFDVIDGAIASASVPGVFPARSLGADTHVDGGCLQNIPLRAAVQLGAERIYTVIAVPISEPHHKAPLWAAEELGYVSTQAENLATPLPEGTIHTIIQPTIEVVGTFEVHPGLMNIDIGYGHLRAEEALADLDEGLEPIVTKASDTITLHRDRAWHIENAAIVNGRITPAQLEALRRAKQAVRSAVQARAALGFPELPEAHTWSDGPELHSHPLPEGFPTAFD